MSSHIPAHKSLDSRLHVAVSEDFLDQAGELEFGDIGLAPLFDDPNIEASFVSLAEERDAEKLASTEALLVMGERIGAELLDRAPRLRLIARFGVGLDAIDLAACAERNIAVTTTPEAVRTPVASAALTLVLALAHNLGGKQRIITSGGWAVNPDAIGLGLTKRRVGIVGLGNIGQEFARLCAPFDIELKASDPFCPEETAAALGVTLCSLDELCDSSDYVVVLCPLTEQTRHLIGRAQLDLLGPKGYLINVSRGEVVDEHALVTALINGGIAGAGLDTFSSEPLPVDHSLRSLPNVIATPHALALTQELTYGNGTQAVANILRLARGEDLHNVANAVKVREP